MGWGGMSVGVVDTSVEGGMSCGVVAHQWRGVGCEWGRVHHGGGISLGEGKAKVSLLHWSSV